MFLEPIERLIYERIRNDGIKEHNDNIEPTKTFHNFVDLPDSALPLGFSQLKLKDIDRESVIVVVHWIGSNLATCYYPQTKRCALEMLLVIG